MDAVRHETLNFAFSLLLTADDSEGEQPCNRKRSQLGLESHQVVAGGGWSLDLEQWRSIGYGSTAEANLKWNAYQQAIIGHLSVATTLVSAKVTSLFAARSEMTILLCCHGRRTWRINKHSNQVRRRRKRPRDTEM